MRTLGCLPAPVVPKGAGARRRPESVPILCVALLLACPSPDLGAQESTRPTTVDPTLRLDFLDSSDSSRITRHRRLLLLPLSSTWVGSEDIPQGIRSRLQEAPLPILDDQGRPISREEIAARVDESGAGGMVLGVVTGLVVGALMGYLASETVSCPKSGSFLGGTRLCSPRESALRDTLGLGFFAIGVIGSGAIGWQLDQTTWWEAIDEIRRERYEILGGERR